MSNGVNGERLVDRRDFLKGSLAVGAMGAVGALGACSVGGDETANPADGTVGEAAPLTAATAAQQKWAFEIPPAPIPDSEIANTIETEIVVIGAGTAGLMCANTAAEGGAKVIIIAMSEEPVGRGGSNHAHNSRIMKELGLNYDIGKAFKAEMAANSYRLDTRKWGLFINRSGEAMDWLIDKMEAAGYTTVVEKGYTDPDGILSAHVGSHSWIGQDVQAAGSSQPQVARVLAESALQSGVEIHYGTTAEQLVREDSGTGRVSAVVAKTADGTYTKYVGSKAIVLATGDFTADPEMVAKYCPEVADLKGMTPNTGDGHKMALWVGASWQRTVPNAPMCGAGGVTAEPYGVNPSLMVTVDCERFMNEDTMMSFLAFAIRHMPQKKAYSIWTPALGGIAAEWQPFGSSFGQPGIPSAEVVAGWVTAAETDGSGVVKGDTIEDLAGKLGLAPTGLAAAVDRYNALCASGVDDDFHKRPELLIPITDGPFYGTEYSPGMLIVTGGLLTNTKMQILDANEQVIPGLYGVGTIVGDMYSNMYTFLMTGVNLGATCVTFGYLTGKALAEGTA